MVGRDKYPANNNYAMQIGYIIDLRGGRYCNVSNGTHWCRWAITPLTPTVAFAHSMQTAAVPLSRYFVGGSASKGERSMSCKHTTMSG